MGMALNQWTLTQKVRKVAKEIWNAECNLPIIISARMTRALGTYTCQRNRFAGTVTPLKLQFSKYLVNGNYNEETIDSVIKHELAHWQVSLRSLHFHDGDYEFENELKRIGSHRTGVIQNAGNVYQCICPKCGRVVVSKPTAKGAMKYANGRYTSRCCHAPLKYVGMTTIEDKNTAPVAKDERIRQASMKTTPSNVLKIEDIIKEKKMNKTVMLNALRKALEEKNQEKLNLLKQHYPETFEGTLRYVPQKLKKAMGL